MVLASMKDHQEMEENLRKEQSEDEEDLWKTRILVFYFDFFHYFLMKGRETVCSIAYQ